MNEASVTFASLLAILTNVVVAPFLLYTGDCMISSIAITHFEFLSIDVNVCVTPAPTVVRPIGLPAFANALVAATLKLFSLTLITNTSCGNVVAAPTPFSPCCIPTGLPDKSVSA